MIMKTTTHTPIPWFVNGPFHIQADTHTEIPVIVADVLPLRSGDVKERDANADLICRAVNCHEDLLEACKLSLKILEYLGKKDLVGFQTIQDAINKAEG